MKGKFLGSLSGSWILRFELATGCLGGGWSGDALLGWWLGLAASGADFPAFMVGVIRRSESIWRQGADRGGRGVRFSVSFFNFTDD